MLTEKTQIILDDVRLYAFHGVLPQERKTGGWFVVTVSVDYPFCRAMDSDDLADSLSYVSVLEVVKREMAVPSNLLEHVAGRILSALFAAYPRITAGEVTVKKENPPMGSNMSGVAVVVRARNE